jgi:hypothetical protein
MRNLIATLLIASFAIALAGPSLADCGGTHGVTAQSPVPTTVATTPTDTTTKTKTEPGTGG